MSTGAKSDNNAQYFQAVVPKRSQYIDFTGTSKQSLPVFSEASTGNSGSAAAVKGTTLVSLYCTEDCWVLAGTNPVAVNPGAELTITASKFVVAGIVDFIGVNPGDIIAVIRDAASGRLHIGEAK